MSRSSDSLMFSSKDVVEEFMFVGGTGGLCCSGSATSGTLEPRPVLSETGGWGSPCGGAEAALLGTGSGGLSGIWEPRPGLTEAGGGAVPWGGAEAAPFGAGLGGPSVL